MKRAPAHRVSLPKPDQRMFSFRAYSSWQVDATRVQSSRRERVCENSLKAELSTGRTHLPTAIGHNKEGGEFSPQKTHRLPRRMVLLHGRLQRAHTRDGKAGMRDEG